ncbi:MAG: hypothetical protein Q7S10_03920 [bacterium]|nr:hypothetical protein [bacterium]
MNKDDEKVLVVPADVMFQKGKWQGMKKDDLEYYVDLIKNNYQFKRRGDVETDPSWQQIIPYIVFNCGSKYFIYKYLEKAGEQRLVDSYQIGVGGHINQVDVNGSPFGTAQGRDVLEAGMMREWNEEVEFKGSILEKKLIGFLYDDSRPVEAVHLGMVYNFVGDSPEISIKEIDKMKGELVELKDIAEKIKGNDGIWIKVVHRDYLQGLLA